MPPRSLPQTLDELLNSKLVHVLLALGKDKQQIAVCSPTTTVSEALKTMAEKNTLSLPILSDPVQNRFVGFVDVMSLVRALMMNISNTTNSDPSASSGAIEALTKAFNETPLKEILPLVEGSADSCVSPSLVLNSTFKDALVPFTAPTAGRDWHVHRLLVTTNDGRLAALFTQSDAVALLARTPELLGEYRGRTLAELRLNSKELVVAGPSTTTREALARMLARGVTSVAVVEDGEGAEGGGGLLDVLSGSDMRAMQELSFEQLNLTVQEFKRRPGATPKPDRPITCEATSTLEEVVRLLSTHRLHRLYVVERHPRQRKPSSSSSTSTSSTDDSSSVALKPVGIITLTDVLTILLRTIA